MKRKSIKLEIPKKATKKIANTTFMYNNFKDEKSGLYFMNDKRGKRLKKDGMITLTDKSMLVAGTINGSKNHWMTYDIDYNILLKMIKKIEKDMKYWKALNKKRKAKKLPQIDNLILHVNPELSLFIKCKLSS